MRHRTIIWMLFFLCTPFTPTAVWSQAANTTQKLNQTPAGWSSFARGGALYQFDTDLDKGGSYCSTRYNIQAGQIYSWDSRTRMSLALSYSYDDYNFSADQTASPAGQSLWNNINSLGLSTPISKGITNNWSAFFIPSLRSSGETGAGFNDTITGGAFAGATYKFGKKLTLGPGLGIVSQLEESASIFPVLIINWKITDTLSLETGRGQAATLGPGLTLNYKPTQSLRFTLGGRYEKLRFRLDKNGDIPGGIGEESSFPLFGGCTYNLNPKTKVSLITGLELGGELKVENSQGDQIREESVDPGVFGGLSFNMRF